MKRFISLLNIALVLGLLVGGCAPATAPTPTPEMVERTRIVEVVPSAPVPPTSTPTPVPTVRAIGPPPGPPGSGDAPYTSEDPTIDGMSTSFEEWAQAYHYPNEFSDGVYSNAGYFYVQNKDDWRAASSQGNRATLPGVTFFLAHDIWGQPDGLLHMFRTPGDNHWNMAEVTLPGGNIVECWILAFGDALDDSDWLSAAGLENSSLIPEGSGNNSIKDVGFIVRLNRDPTTDRHWFPGDPEPGDPDWNDEEYYGCFGMWGFNNSFHATNLDTDPAHSDENVVYEWKFSGIREDWPLQCQQIKVRIIDPPKRWVIYIARDWRIHVLPPSPPPSPTPTHTPTPTPEPEKVATPAPTAKDYVEECNTLLEQGKPLLVEHTDCTLGIELVRSAIEKATAALELNPSAEACLCRAKSRIVLGGKELKEAIPDLECAVEGLEEGNDKDEAKRELETLRQSLAEPPTVVIGAPTCAEGWTESNEPINPGPTFPGGQKEIWCRVPVEGANGEIALVQWYEGNRLSCQHDTDPIDKSWTWFGTGWTIDPGEEWIEPGPYRVEVWIGPWKMTERDLTVTD